MPLSVKQLLSALLISFMMTIALSGCGKIADPVPPGTLVSQTGTGIVQPGAESRAIAQTIVLQ